MRVERSRGFCVVRPNEGRRAIGTRMAQELEDTICLLVEQGEQLIVVDLCEIRAISVTGKMALWRGTFFAAKEGGRVVLVQIGDGVMDRLEKHVGLKYVGLRYPSLDEAVRGLLGEP